MKVCFSFLQLFISFILFCFSLGDEFIPLKPENGLLNQPYNHTSKEKNLSYYSTSLFFNISESIQLYHILCSIKRLLPKMNNIH